MNLASLTELNQSIYVRDLVVAAGVKLLAEPETVIVTVTPPLKEEVVAPVADVTAVKSESEEKKLERDKEKAEKTEE